MNDRITIGSMYPGSLHPASLHNKRQSSPPGSSAENGVFKELLRENQIKISQHAAKRMEQRGIQLQSDQLAQISTAVEQAAAKGSKESLILLRDMAFIVNVHNRTMVTAMDGKAMKDNVFTQIDSAVIIS
ncbi:flagellar biosynthesis protein [Paenibacillus sp. F411]|uniref:TIGR02530 family flagellar biosynthesis protein n=1 Tax=Paenibacillus sp. F411 TaxID=2820239 RepID=UPI001AAF0636|nr:TIGR02530 family flagellar biosynthesis protein [Paenibacillus sp. F411]MBO2945751.1 flagellar biosynthesis protein [Paenibacillus sp. F411]